MPYGLGRRHAPDPRDAAHLMLAVAPAPPPALPSFRYWRLGAILDQGDLPQCVGYAWEQWLQTTPVRTTSGPAAAVIYNAAQLLDEFNDTPPADGTSVRAGAKFLQDQGRFTEYVWATATGDLKLWLATKGPVVLGTNWYDGMFQPSVDGVVAISGALAGGHAYLCMGYGSNGMFRCVNSWGTGWGQRGRFWLAEATLARLLAEDGEACGAAEIRLAA